MSFMLNIILMKVVAAGGGAAAGSVAGPLGTLGGAVVSIVKAYKVLLTSVLGGVGGGLHSQRWSGACEEGGVCEGC